MSLLYNIFKKLLNRLLRVLPPSCVCKKKCEVDYIAPSTPQTQFGDTFIYRLSEIQHSYPKPLFSTFRKRRIQFDGDKKLIHWTGPVIFNELLDGCTRCQKEYVSEVVYKEFPHAVGGNMKAFESEVKLLKSLKFSLYIVNILAYGKETITSYIVFEKYERSLYEHLFEGHMEGEVEMDRIVRDISTGIMHLHSMNVVHRNICLNNILLKREVSAHNIQYRAVISELGNSVRGSEETSVVSGFPCTTGYFHPVHSISDRVIPADSVGRELCPITIHEWKQVDIWCFGVSVVVLYTREFPSYSESGVVFPKGRLKNNRTLSIMQLSFENCNSRPNIVDIYSMLQKARNEICSVA